MAYNGKTLDAAKFSTRAEWINELRYFYLVDFYTAVKINEKHLQAAAQMNFTNTMFHIGQYEVCSIKVSHTTVGLHLGKILNIQK